MLYQSNKLINWLTPDINKFTVLTKHANLNKVLKTDF
jgi:hypothetical protein